MNSLLLSFFPSFLLPPPVYNCEICPRLSLKCSVGLEHSYSDASKPRTGQKRSQNRIGARGFSSFCPTLAVFITPITEQRTTRHSPLFSPVKTSSAKKKKKNQLSAAPGKCRACQCRSTSKVGCWNRAIELAGPPLKPAVCEIV